MDKNRDEQVAELAQVIREEADRMADWLTRPEEVMADWLTRGWSVRLTLPGGELCVAYVRPEPYKTYGQTTM